MYQVNQAIWNQIAATGKVKTQTFQKLFTTTPEDRDNLLQDQERKLEKAGHSDKLILAYQMIAPIWTEQEAIRAFLKKPGNCHLSNVLPELNSPSEAVVLMVQEYNLSLQDAKTLLQMLTKLTSKPNSLSS